MRGYIKFLLFGVLGGVLCALPFLTGNETILFSEVVLKFGFSEFELSAVGVIDFFEWFSPLLLFQIFWGTYIYRHFCSASVYYFSRCNHRVSWFLKEAAFLYPYTIIYLLIMVLSGTIVAEITNHIYFNAVSFVILAYYLLIHSLWIYLATLLINILAIRLSSSGAFIIVGGFQMFCMAVFASWEGKLTLLGDVENPMKEMARILPYNPLSHLIIPWHSSQINSVDKSINRFGLLFDLNYSVLLFALICIVVICLGCFIVKKQDFIVTNRETGGM